MRAPFPQSSRPLHRILLPIPLLLLAVLPAAPSADGPESRPSAVLSLGRQDFGWAAAVALTAIPAQIRYFGMDPVDTNALDRNKDLWLMDRWIAGAHSERSGIASNALILPLISLPMAATALEAAYGRQSWGSAVEDGVVYAEAMLISSSLNLLVRSTGVHPRPLVYSRDVAASDRFSPEASGSFYSGHANAAFLSAVYFSYTYGLRHPESRYRGTVWAGSLGAAAVVAGMRVAAGKHYLSDVLVGAAVGSFFGWAFPYMHRSKAEGESGGLGVGLYGGGDGGAYPLLTWTF